MVFTDEVKEDLNHTVGYVMRLLEKLKTEINDIPANAGGLDYSLALLTIGDINTELRYVKTVLKENEMEDILENPDWSGEG